MPADAVPEKVMRINCNSCRKVQQAPHVVGTKLTITSYLEVRLYKLSSLGCFLQANIALILTLTLTLTLALHPCRDSFNYHVCVCKGKE